MKRVYRLIYLNLLILICLSSIAALSGIYFYKTKQLVATNYWVTHTQQTLIKGYSILSDELLMRLATQKFILTGESDYLNSYQKSIQSLHNNVYTLQNLTLDNALQQTRLEQLKKLMQQESDTVNSLVAFKKDNILDYSMQNSMLRKLFSDIPKSEIITNKVNSILDEEKNLLNRRSADFVNHLIVLNKIGLVVDVISLLVIFVCLVLLNRQLITHFITERKLERSEKRFKNLAYTDSITGLNNRISLIDKLNNLIQNAKLTSNKIVLFYIDLDNFKNINDSFGHPVGDELLRSTASKIKSVFNENAYLFRISGDEFAIILENITDQNKIVMLAQKLLDSFAIPVELNNHKIMNTISMGICTYPTLSDDANSLLRNADIAMYKSKQLGKNNYQFCNLDMINEFENRARLYHRLQTAVMNKEFILVYQPKLCLKTNKLSGLEALIRWKNADMGIIYPHEFISIAENNGLIIPIGEWVMRSVCDQAKQWQQDGINISNIAFNVSIREFVMRDFTSTISNILQDLEIDPHNLEIEITETILMEEYWSNFNSLDYLKSLGIKITIDDFGTGYSSLNYLNLFPVDKLKIDKSFIAQINQQNPEPVIISAIISMAHQLGIQVVAEGVETEMQLNYLRHHGCDEIQGYHFSKPLFVEEINDFILNHQLK